MFARRDVRKSRISSRLSTTTTLGPLSPGREALSVPVSAGTAEPPPSQVARWLLGGQRTRVRDAVAHPASQVVVGLDRLGVYPKPAVHLPAAHLEAAHVRLADQRLRLGRVDAQQQAALTAGTDGHVALDEEGESAEHPPLGQAGLGLYDCADPIGELDVVRHPQSLSRTPHPRWRPRTLLPYTTEIPRATQFERTAAIECWCRVSKGWRRNAVRCELSGKSLYRAPF